MSKTVIIGLITFIGLCCSMSNIGRESLPSTREIDSIQVLYFKYFTKAFAFNIACDAIIQSKGVMDTTISNRDVLIKIQERLPYLALDTLNVPYMDARLTSTIYYKDGSTSKLCFLTPYSFMIYFDDNLYLWDNQLLYYIKKYSGFYEWMPQKEILKMPEIIDTTFYKDPIIIMRKEIAQ